MSSVLTDGLIIMVIGMGVVFVFLMLMVWAMHGMHNFLAWFNKFMPEPVEVVKTKKTKNNNENDEATVAVAIAACVNKLAK